MIRSLSLALPCLTHHCGPSGKLDPGVQARLLNANKVDP
jgi:hypothetical protein